MDQKLESVARSYHFDVEMKDDVAKFRLDCLGLTLWAESLGKDSYYPYFVVRTSSFYWAGERSDLHEVTSFLLGAYLHVTGTASCHFRDECNPIAPDLPEVYASVILPRQPINISYELNLESMGALLRDVHVFNLVYHNLLKEYCPAQTDSFAGTWQTPELIAWANRLSNAMPESFDASVDGYTHRLHPENFYYRAANGSTTIIKDRNACDVARYMYESLEGEELPGVNGTVRITGDLRNCIPDSGADRARSIALAVGENGDSIIHFPLENVLLSVGRQHLIIQESNTGRDGFAQERHRIALRRQRESELLFAPSDFEWSRHIDGQDFEDMVRDLLAAHPAVFGIESIGPARERDSGRDMMVDINVAAMTNHKWNESGGNIEKITCVVQCKASRNTVGVKDVTEIRDVIEDSNANGFLLVVASRVSSALTTRLQIIREKDGHWTRWWDRTDLELLLRRNPDILVRYPNVIRPANG